MAGATTAWLSPPSQLCQLPPLPAFVHEAKQNMKDMFGTWKNWRKIKETEKRKIKM